MSTETVSMRPALRQSTKVFAIARFLAASAEFRAWYGLAAESFPNLEAIKLLVSGGLLVVWGTARSTAPDGFFRAGVLEDLDGLSGIPQFGAAMQAVGWAQQVEGGIALPNFEEWNSSEKKRGGVRAKTFGQEDLIPGLEGVQGKRFDEFWKAYPRKCGKGAARKKWAQMRPSLGTLQQMLAAIAVQKKSPEWKKEKGQYIPHPATWLNQTRWEDVPQEAVSPKDEEQEMIRQAARNRESRLAEESRPMGG